MLIRNLFGLVGFVQYASFFLKWPKIIALYTSLSVRAL